MRNLKPILAIALSSITLPAFAHVGEHSVGLVEGLVHFLSQPTHLWPVVGVTLLLIGLGIKRLS